MESEMGILPDDERFIPIMNFTRLVILFDTDSEDSSPRTDAMEDAYISMLVSLYDSYGNHRFLSYYSWSPDSRTFIMRDLRRYDTLQRAKENVLEYLNELFVDITAKMNPVEPRGSIWEFFGNPHYDIVVVEGKLIARLKEDR